MQNQLRSVNQVAESLTVKESTIRSWIFQRRIPTKKIGRCVRIEQSVVDKILEEGLESVEPVAKAT
jgi:excisionase family DNA binding protein